MGWLLAIDTCGSVGTVELFDTDGRTVANAALPGRETQERLMPAIQQVLSQASLKPDALTALAVVTGPGSFTGVRIGLAAVKGLAEALDLPVIALSRLAVLAAAAPTAAQQTVHAWLDAGRNDVYAGVLRRNDDGGSTLTEDLLTRQAAAQRVGTEDIVAVLEPVLSGCASNTIQVTHGEFQQSLRHLVLEAMQRGDFADSTLLDANYLRVPDAELALRARAASSALPGTAH